MASNEITRSLGKIVVAIATGMAMTACSVVGPRSSPLPTDGPTLVDVYRDHMETEGSGRKQARDALPRRALDAENESSLRRASHDPLQQRFQRLPNPDLVMHVYPHLARGKYPVPGYVTVFPMYETVEYAMPGEVQRDERPLAGAGASASTTKADGTATERASERSPARHETGRVQAAASARCSSAEKGAAC